MQTSQIDRVLSMAQTVTFVANLAKNIFVERDEMLEAFTSCFVAGKHGLLLGKPGIAKSAVIQHMAHGLGLSYFRYLLDADTTKDDMFGSISAKHLVEKDEYRRKWAGLATAHVAFLDEPGKAPNSVLNLLLSALNERIGFSLYEVENFPLHSCWGASNEMFDDNPAIWDRWHVRIPVEDVTSTANLWCVMTGDITAPMTQSTVHIDPDVLPISRTLVKELCASAKTSRQLYDLLVVLKTEVETVVGKGEISSRRWADGLALAAGSALARGSTTIEEQDFAVYVHMLWTKHENYAKVRKIVLDLCDSSKRELEQFREKVVMIKTALNNTPKSNLKETIRVITTATQLWSANLDKIDNWKKDLNDLRVLINQYTT